MDRGVVPPYPLLLSWTGAFRAASCSLSILLYLPFPSTPLLPKNTFCPSLNLFGTCRIAVGKGVGSQSQGFGVTHQTLCQLIQISCVSRAFLLSCWFSVFFTWIFAEVTSKCWAGSARKPNRNIHLRPRSLIFSTNRSSLLCKCEGLAFYLSLLLKQDIPGMSTSLPIFLL